ncbi:hypothetical protein CISIN_1g039230mg, partial [Citrus sinensis]
WGSCMANESNGWKGMHYKREAKFLTRCALDRLAAIVSELTDEQKQAASDIGLGRLIQISCGRLKRKLCSWLVERIETTSYTIELNGANLELSCNSFSYIMGVSDGGMPIQLEGDRSRVAIYLEKFNATSSGINIKILSDILRNCRGADDDFKVTFMLFTLCTVLCPPIGVHISSSFLYSLIDVNCIKKMNWATFSFNRLMQGIIRYKEDNHLTTMVHKVHLQIMNPIHLNVNTQKNNTLHQVNRN